MEISPYVVFRRNRLAPTDLIALSFDDQWKALEKLRDRRTELRKLTSSLTSRIEKLIGQQPPENRSNLISLRRDVHNGRIRRVHQAIRSTAAYLDTETVRYVNEWLSYATTVSNSEMQVTTAFNEAISEKHRELRQLFFHDAVERSIQLSGQQLYRNLYRFLVDSPKKIKPSKRRTLESSLVNFLYRAAYKPSPFSRFTEIGAFDPHTPQAPPRLLEAKPDRSVITVNRLLVNWVLAALPLVDGGLDIGYLFLNSTLQEKDGLVTYIGVPPNRRQDGKIPPEKVIRFQADEATAALLAKLSSGPQLGLDVLNSISEKTGNSKIARELILGLLRLGVIFYRPKAGDHDPKYAERLLKMLPRDKTKDLTEIHDAFTAIVRLESEVGSASATVRTKLFYEAERAIETIARIAGVTTPPSDVLKSLVYEDTAAIQPPSTWAPIAISSSKGALSSLWALSCALDSGQIQRLGLYSFANQVSENQTTIPFVKFFELFSGLSDADQAAVLSGGNSTEAKKFIDQRDKALKQMRNAVEIERNTAYLSSDAIRDALSGIDDLLLPDSIAFRMQFTQVDNSPTPVINGVMTGFGVYVSRFGTFTQPTQGWDLASAQRTHLAHNFPRQVDLNAVLGFNFNLHPPVTRAVVDYPGALSQSTGQKTYSPADLQVKIDNDKKRLTLWDANYDEPVDLVPLNFMAPYGVPLLYRLLEHLSPSVWYRWQPLRDILGSEYPTASAPRLVIDNVIVDRSAWVFPASEIPNLEALASGDFSVLDSFDKWRLQNNLPREVFALCQTVEESNIFAGRGGQSSRNWSDYAHLRRATVHKPMYVDFRNPLLLQSFAKSALSRPGVVATLRECCPRTEDYFDTQAANTAEEFLVEFNKS